MKSLNEIIDSLKNAIKSKNSQFNVNEGTIINDILINVPAQEINDLYTELGNVSNKVLLNNLTSDELDSLGSSLFIPRRVALPSKGKIIFRALNVTPSINIPKGTLVGTSSFSIYKNISFTLDSDITMDSTNSRFVGGYYEGEGFATCTSSGTSGNIPANTISLIVSTLDSRVVGVYNPESFSGGADLESDNDYLNRILLLLRSGSSIGTLSYLKYLIESHPSARVLDYHVYLPNDPKLKRNPYGDSIDVYVISKLESQVTETLSTDDYNHLIPSHKPVFSLSTSGITFVSDWDSDFARSSKSLDHFETSSSGSFEVTYTYNKNIEDLQNWIDDPDHKPLTLDVLIKEAKIKDVKVVVWIIRKGGYDTDTLRTNVLTSLKNFINSNKLNQNIYLSDIVGVIEGVDGVDYIDTDVNGELRISLYSKYEKDTGYPAQAQPVLTTNEIEYFMLDESNSEINIS